MIIAVLVFAQLTVYASSRNRSISLTIESSCDGEPVANEEFELYEFAHYDNEGSLIISDDFKDYDVDFFNMTEENWQDLVEILTAYAARDDIEPQCVGETDDRGILVFTEEGSALTDAVYLVVGQTVDDENTRYTCEPFFVSLPRTENGDYIYDEVVYPKLFPDAIPETTEIKVLKVWDDKGSTSKRPESIEVQLLADGKIYETQTLNKDNNWRYSWNNLDGSVNWSVVEKDVPSGYTVILNDTDGTFTLTNTAKLTNTQTTNEFSDSNKSPNSTTSTNLATEKSTSANTEKLPRTGLYWMPVVILLFAGITFIVLGFIKNNNGEIKYESE
jgi:hypothetical protein